MTKPSKQAFRAIKRAKNLGDMSAEQYLREIVAPTIAEFEADPTSVRRAMVACVVIYQTRDYFEPRLNLQLLRVESPDFSLIAKVVNAARHRKPDEEPPPRSKDIPGPPQEVLDQTVGDYSRRDDSNADAAIQHEAGIEILRALKQTEALLWAKARDRNRQTSRGQ